MANDIPIIGATVAVVKNTDGTHDYVGPSHPLNTTSDLTVDGQKVDATHPVPTTTAITFPASMSTTDATVRRMQNLWWETGASVSNTVVLGDHERISSLLLPASGWATTATRIYFDVSDDGVTWYPAQDLAGNLIYAVVGAAAATKGVTLSDEERARISRCMVRFKSTTDAGVAVTQAAAVACRLGSVGAETADPYSTFSFRVASGGSGTFEITGAGRVIWIVNGATTATTIGNTLTLSTLSAPVDISVSAAFDFKDSYLNFHDGSGVSFKLAHLPAKLGKLRLAYLESSVISGSLADVPRSLTTLLLAYLGSSVITGSLADTPRCLTYLYLYSLGSSVITGSLADTPRCLTYLYLYSLGSSNITGNLATDLPTLITGSLWIYDVGGTIAGAAPQSVFGVGCNTVRLYNQSFTADDTDNTIINLAAAVTALSITNGTAVFETNRTSASDAALATLVSAGWSVTFA